MPAPYYRPDPSRAENLVQQLASRLGQHVFWDSLFIFLPPVGAAIYIIAVLFRTAWIGLAASLTVMMAVVAAGIAGALLRYRPRVPSISAAARLADRQSGAKDHFLTLATIDSAIYPLSFVAKLRRESSAFGERIELKRDFPYKLKRSAYWSVGASLFAALLLHFALPMLREDGQGTSFQRQLHRLAQAMAAKPELQSTGLQLEAVVSKLEDPKIGLAEKQEAAQQMEKRIKEQQQTEPAKDNRDLLGQAAGALEGMDQQVASGKSGDKDQQKGGGGIDSNLAQNGQGESKEGQGSGKGNGKAEVSADSKQDKAGQAKSTDSGKENNPQQSGAAKDSQQPDAGQTKKADKQQAGKAEGPSKEGAGNQKAPDQPPPPGMSPADRFYAAGEGQQGLQGARYVTVQLPEDIVADEKAESRPSKDSKANRTRSQVPVSNVPLPAHVPNAATEKQHIPIEYRDMIR